MLKRPFLFFVFSFFLYKCDFKKQSFDTELKVISQTLPSFSSEVPLTEYFEINSVIVLESTDSSIVDYIYKVLKNEDFIFVKGGNALFKFDKNGKFLDKLTKGDGGPNDYVNLTDVLLIPDIERIWIYDSNQRSIFQYNYNLEFETEFILDYPLFGLEKLEKGLVGSPGYMDISNEFYSLYFFSGENLITGIKPLDHSLPFNKEKSKYLHVYRHDFFSKFNGGFNFVNSFNDTIYFVNDLIDVQPNYLIDFGSNRVTEDDLVGKGFTSIVDVFQYINSKEKSYNVGNIIESKNLLLYRFFNKGIPYVSILNKGNDKLISGHRINFSYNKQVISFELDEESSFGKIDDSLGYLTIPSESSVIGDFQSVFNVNDGDNPIIIFLNEK